jgi:coenzyme F420 hydrogenase subunit beta
LIRIIQTLQDVVDWGLCTGCGACYYACAKGHLRLVNIETIGIRPHIAPGACADCNRCLSICPGYSLDGDLVTGHLSPNSHAHEEFGSALEIWEGHATDAEIRYRGSSGGVLSALTVYCLEREGMAFALHSAMDERQPWLNTTVQSRTRGEILARAGSRYAPASPCDGLSTIEASDQPCVFIGKPCDTAAVFKLRSERPALSHNLGLVLSFFCAGTPSTQGTIDLLKNLHITKESVSQVRYRGEGWPGRFKVFCDNTGERSLSYPESWGRLSHYRPLRCQLCPDGLGRIADISCGDAWERFDGTGDPGRSLVIVRTERGREILHRAMAANYVQLTPATAANVLAAQPNLLQKRRELFGRLAALQMCLVPVPSFRGFSLLRAWMCLPLSRKARTLLGTIKRVITRGLWRRKRMSFAQSSQPSPVLTRVAGQTISAAGVGTIEPRQGRIA